MTLEQELEMLNSNISFANYSIVDNSIQLYRTKNREIKADLKGWIKRDIESILKWKERKTVVVDQIFKTKKVGV
jgi:hypothetical protein